MFKFWLGVGVGILISLLVVFTFVLITSRNFEGLDQTPVLVVNKERTPAVYDLNLVNLHSNEPVDSGIFKNKVCVFNYWEKWCVPCREELESLAKLYNSVNDSTVQFAIISSQDQPGTSKDSITLRNKLPFYHLQGLLPDVYNRSVFPRTYIINKKGEIVVQEFGARNWAIGSTAHFIDSLKRL